MRRGDGVLFLSREFPRARVLGAVDASAETVCSGHGAGSASTPRAASPSSRGSPRRLALPR